MAVFIVSDDRERDVAPFLADGADPWAPAGFAPCPVVTRRVTTGDFHVCAAGRAGAPARVLACVERKTLSDFAASFKDGRYANVEKMLELRAATGCALMFFVEGPAFPSPGRRIARIPYVNIRAAIDSLLVQGIPTVLTEDPADTAARLRGIARAYARAPAAVPAAAAAATAVTAAAPAAATAPAAAPAAATASATASATAPADGPTSADGPASDENMAVPEELTAPKYATPRAEGTAMWSTLAGISQVTGRVLTDAFSVGEIATGLVGDAQVAAVRMPSGRALGADALRSLAALRAGDVGVATRVLTAVRGVSRATAETLLAGLAGPAGVAGVAGVAAPGAGRRAGLADLCRAPPGVLADVRIPHGAKTQRLGEARAARIHDALWYGPRPEPCGVRLGDV